MHAPIKPQVKDDIAMDPVTKIRNALWRWLGREESKRPGNSPDGRNVPTPVLNSKNARLASFVKKVRAQSQDWLGRIHLINFDAVRERLGDKWPRLEERVELLAERIIREELTSRDCYIKLGGAEFLIYIADAGPEETGIRCLAILNSLEEKLFGAVDNGQDSPTGYVSCHTVRADIAASEWDAFGSDDARMTDEQAGLRALFRREADILDWLELGNSMHGVIDGVIADVKDSCTIEDLAPLVERLTQFSRSGKVLENAILRRAGGPNGFPLLATDSQSSLEWKENCRKNAMMVAERVCIAMKDIAELIAVLDIESECTFSNVLAGLTKLERKRESRKGAGLGESGAEPRFVGDYAEAPKIEYVPVFRCLGQGSQIYQGINRVVVQSIPRLFAASPDGTPPEEQSQSSQAEQIQLEHALRCILEADSRFLLMIGVHVSMLYSPYRFKRYCNTLRAAQIQARRKLIIDVIGYGETDKTIAVRRAIDVLRMQTRAVFVSTFPQNVMQLRKIAAECRALGIHALGLDVSQSTASDFELMSEIRNLAQLRHDYGIATHLSGIASPGVLADAISGGINYICTPALRPPQPAPLGVGRTTLAEICANG